VSGGLSDPRVAEAAVALACAQVDVDARQDLYRRYVVEDVPCVLFFDGDGSVVGRKDNEYRNSAERLLESMAEAKRRAAVLAARETDLQARTLQSPKDPELAVDLGNHYYEVYRFAPALEAFRRAVRLLPPAENERIEEILIRVVYLEIVMGDLDAALAEIDRFLRERPESRHRDTVAFYRGYAFYERRDHARAAAEWRGFLKTYAASPLRKEVEDYLRSLGE
jgi:tetratricopeptide (TPR) repeat protein